VRWGCDGGVGSDARYMVCVDIYDRVCFARGRVSTSRPPQESKHVMLCMYVCMYVCNGRTCVGMRYVHMNVKPVCGRHSLHRVLYMHR